MTDRRIRAALAEAVSLGEIGVQVAAYLHEELIVDEWIGLADAEAGTEVTGDTLFPVFSVGKAIVAAAVQLQAERGLLSLDAPVAEYWPEYAQNGKAGITVRHVLTHRAGVPQMPVDTGVPQRSQWDEIVGCLAAVKPLAPPGERTIYHALSFGYILGEVVRRTDPARRLPDEFVRTEICDAVDIPDVWMGIPPSQECRVARLSWGAGPAPTWASTPFRTMSVPPAVAPRPEIWNRPEVQRALVPAAGVIMSARSGAKFFSLLANGGALGGKRLFSNASLLKLTKPRSRPAEIDEGIGRPMWLGVGGFRVGGPVPPAERCVGSGAHILAQKGIDGSIGWADLDTGLAVMITHNRMFHGEEPFASLSDAVRDVAGVG